MALNFANNNSLSASLNKFNKSGDSVMSLNFANNNSLSAITSLPASISGGELTLLETQTASSSATISFTSNIDSTYDAYMFKFYDIHPATDGVYLNFQASTNGGSS